jgi:hypothetical protein
MKSIVPAMGRCLATILAWSTLAAPGHAQPPASWTHQTFADFSAGKFDAAGQNLYVARDGSIRAIHRFDLNQDGWIELSFQSTHDWSFGHAASVGAIVDRKVRAEASLEVKGSMRVILEDLNRDGHLDALFCPNDNWVSGRRALAIAWGGPDGWSNARLNGALMVNNATRISVGDYDGDGWPDIAALCGGAWLPGQPAGQIVRIYWGGPEGFLLPRRSDFGISGAIDLLTPAPASSRSALAVLTKHGTVEIHSSLSSRSAAKLEADQVIKLPDRTATTLAAGDLNGDGNSDLIVGTSEEKMYVVDGAAGGRWNEARTVPAGPAFRIAVGDLDQDGRLDLVLTNYHPRSRDEGRITLLWGASAGFEVQPLPFTEFHWASAAAIGDLNADGRPDLVFVQYRDEDDYFTEGKMLLNEGGRKFSPAPGVLNTAGSLDVAIAPLASGSPGRVVVANAIGASTTEEKGDSYVYWGGPKGFSRDARFVIPDSSGFQAAAADLNHDGHVDLIAPYFGHGTEVEAGDRPHYQGINIFWGGPDGYDLKRRTLLPNKGADGRPSLLPGEKVHYVNVADIDRDGWLDIVAGQHNTEVPKATPQIIIYRGGPDGFSPDRRITIPSPGRSVPVILADMNADGWLDLVVGSRLNDEHKIRIFNGGPNGFSEKNQSILPFFSALDLEVADLNADGHPDLIASARSDLEQPYTDLGVWIYWGSEGPYRQSNAQWLPATAALGITAADFDGDGHLDLMLPSYHGGDNRDFLRHFLYWGGPDGFSVNSRTEFHFNAASDSFAADFNHDGRLDLCLVIHTSNDGHLQNSKIILNDGNRFQHPQIEDVPAIGPHWMWGSDMGHINHRRWEQNYESAPLTWKAASKAGQLSFGAEIPAGAALDFEVRSAATESELGKAAWRKVNAGRFDLTPADRCLQYRAVFKSSNGDNYPVLRRVSVGLD